MTEEVRAHAVLSASGYKKWATCTMSPALEREIPDESSPWAAEGTFGHAVGENRLRAWLGLSHVDEESIEGYDEFFTDELSDYVNVYVQFVIDAVTSAREAHGPDNVTVLLEQRLDFSRFVPEGFGTGDCVIVWPGAAWTIDLKMGAGVRVTDSGQLRLYNLGAYDRYSVLYDIQELTTTIVQPRMDNITTETITAAELLTWAEELVAPRAKIAWAAYNGDRSQARFSPGEHCATAFCKARFRCSARARYMLEAAEQPFALNAPDLLTVEQLEGIVDRARLAVKWLADCERHLTAQAKAGAMQLKHHALAPGITRRVITDEKAAAQVLMENGFAATDVYAPPKLRGLGALEGVVGGPAKLRDLLGELLEKPEGELRLVPKVEGAETPPARHASAAAEFDDV